jgi:hypothetical protein
MPANIVVTIVAIASVIGLFVGFYASCYVWMRRWLSGEVVKDVLAEWDLRLLLASPDEREDLRAQPPVEVLEATFALRSRQRRFPLSIAR